jgi:hypothetical protein
MEQKRKKPTFKKSEINLSATSEGFTLATVISDDGQYYKKRYMGYTKADVKAKFYNEFAFI